MSIKSELVNLMLGMTEKQYIKDGYGKAILDKCHQAILAEVEKVLPKERHFYNSPQIEHDRMHYYVERGYNQCLADMKAKLHSEKI